VLACGIRLYGVNWGLPEGYEEATPLRRAWEMWGWGLDRGVDLNPHFFKYPSLTIYLQGIAQGALYLGMKLSGAVESAVDFHVSYVLDKTPFFVLGRSLNVIFGTATVALLFLFGRRTGGYAAGITAAFWLAVNTAHVSRSQMIEVDVPLAFFTLLTLWLLMRAMERPSVLNFAYAGMSMGLAASTKYTGALLGLALSAAVVIVIRDGGRALASGGRIGRNDPGGEGSGSGRRGSRNEDADSNRTQKKNGGRSDNPRRKGAGRTGGGAKGGRDRRSRHSKSSKSRKPDGSRKGHGGLKPGLLLILAAFAVALGVFSLTSPFVILDFDAFWAHFSAEREHMRLGHFGEGGDPTWLHYARLIATDSLGWPIALLALGGVACSAGFRRERWSWMVCAFLIPYAVGISTWEMRADRYLMPIIPLLCLFAGNSLSAAPRVGRLSRTPAPAKALLVGGLALAAAVPMLKAYPEHLRRVGPDTRSVAARWISENAPAGSFIVTEHYGPQLLGPAEYMELDPVIRREIRARGEVGKYAVQMIPMFQVLPERASVYYDLSLYGDADYLITTSSVRSRYLREPSRFDGQIAFYESLEESYLKVFEITSANRTGPSIEIFRNPLRRLPFAGRGAVAGVPLVPAKRDRRAFEADFYGKMGFNYEFYSHFEGALGCYTAGLSYQMTSFALMKSLVLGAVRCLSALGRQEEIPALLDGAIAAAPSEAAREELSRIKRSATAGAR
jgi:hypothetical protein